MVSVYNPLGIVSPLLMIAKQLYRTICDQKLPWDKQLPTDIERKWSSWLKSLPELLTIPRSIPILNKEINGIVLHGFGDASKEGCCSVVYVVVNHSEGTTM